MSISVRTLVLGQVGIVSEGVYVLFIDGVLKVISLAYTHDVTMDSIIEFTTYDALLSVMLEHMSDGGFFEFCFEV